ncbi:MarR family winged helix-turn-helix transcriptional regulator [Pseudonocardia sp. GCM10023141]|uniref:MarR family winged helix-turn-helix transcriptional regulator n=1 Tax=Pseudonocardia sp. GCM10023141 TaxID=3252653 RepID=UPI00360EFA01
MTEPRVTEPGAAASSDVPMARLLAMAYRLLVDGLHERLARRGWDGVRPAFGFVLLALAGGPATVKDLTAALGTSKQAVSQLVDDMVGSGYATRAVHPEDARARNVALTDQGHRLLGAVEEVYRELEDEWAQLIGAGRLDQVRADLQAVLRAAYGGELPSVRPVG